MKHKNLGATLYFSGRRKYFSVAEVLDILDDSDLDLSDGDTHQSDEDPDFQAAKDDESDDESDDGGEEESRDDDDQLADEIDGDIQPSTPTGRGCRIRGRPRGRRGTGGGRGRSRAPVRIQNQVKWTQDETFNPRNQPEAAADVQFHPAANNDRQNWAPSDYFKQYFNGETIEMIANATQQTAVQNTGRSLGTTPEEITRFIGINIMMGALRFPRIRMYWAHRTGVDAIRQAMTRNRFLKLRSNLKVVVVICLSYGVAGCGRADGDC